MGVRKCDKQYLHTRQRQVRFAAWASSYYTKALQVQDWGLDYPLTAPLFGDHPIHDILMIKV